MVPVALLGLLAGSSAVAAAAGGDAEGDPVLARLDGAAVRRSDLLREERFMAPGERRRRKHDGLSLRRNRREWLVRASLRRIATIVARREKLFDEPEIRERFREAGRRWLVKQWEGDCYGFGLDLPSDEQLRSELAGSALTLPARIRLSHIFLQAMGAKEEQAARERLGRIRASVHSLEEFREEARLVSQSLSSRRGGRIGYVRKGWIPDAAWNQLLGLAPGSISPPIKLKGGYHLFFVEAQDPERPLPEAQRLKRMREDERRRQQDACRKRRLGEARATARMVTGADELRVEDWRIGRQTLDTIYGGEQRELGEKRRNLPEETLRSYIEKELLYQAALQSPTVDPILKLRARDLQENYLLGEVIRRRREGLVREPRLDELKDSYEEIRRGYIKRKELRLTVMKTAVPVSGDPMRFVDGLKERAEKLRTGSANFVDLCDYIDTAGSVEHWPMQDGLVLAHRLGPIPFEEVRKAAAGDVVGPFRDGEHLYIVRVDAVMPARRLTFEEAIPRLRKKLRREAKRTATARLVDDLLADFHFALTDDGKALLEESGGKTTR